MSSFSFGFLGRAPPKDSIINSILLERILYLVIHFRSVPQGRSAADVEISFAAPTISITNDGRHDHRQEIIFK